MYFEVFRSTDEGVERLVHNSPVSMEPRFSILAALLSISPRMTPQKRENTQRKTPVEEQKRKQKHMKV